MKAAKTVAAKEAAEKAAAVAVARAIDGYKRADRFGGMVATMDETLADLDSKLLRAAGLLACEQRTNQPDGPEGQEVLTLIASVRESLEWMIRRPLENAGVLGREPAKGARQ